jgi:hypothetical protein
LGRLSDSIARRSINGIQEIIEYLASTEDKPTERGFKYLEKRFKGRIIQIKTLKIFTRNSITLAFITIILSLTSIVFVEEIKCCPLLFIPIICVNMALTIITMVITIKGINLGLEDQEDV